MTRLLSSVRTFRILTYYYAYIYIYHKTGLWLYFLEGADKTCSGARLKNVGGRARERERDRSWLRQEVSIMRRHSATPKQSTQILSRGLFRAVK